MVVVKVRTEMDWERRAVGRGFFVVSETGNVRPVERDDSGTRSGNFDGEGTVKTGCERKVPPVDHLEEPIDMGSTSVVRTLGDSDVILSNQHHLDVSTLARPNLFCEGNGTRRTLELESDKSVSARY